MKLRYSRLAHDDLVFHLEFIAKDNAARDRPGSRCLINGGDKLSIVSPELPELHLFKQGLLRVMEGARKYRIALMCAEKDPLQCHRTILVAKTSPNKAYPFNTFFLMEE